MGITMYILFAKMMEEQSFVVVAIAPAREADVRSAVHSRMKHV